MKYAWIAKHKRCWPVVLTCEVLAASVSGYFEHQRHTGRECAAGIVGKRVQDGAVLVHIRAIHAEVKGEYGWPKIHRELQDRGTLAKSGRIK